MSKLTTHILDTAHGRPAKGIHLRLYRLGAREELVAKAITNDDGRCDAPILQGESMQPGTYRLEFDVAEYFKAQGVKLPEMPFLDTVLIRFGIADPNAHYHVPLLVSPYGYSTYRGS